MSKMTKKITKPNTFVTQSITGQAITEVSKALLLRMAALTDLPETL